MRNRDFIQRRNAGKIGTQPHFLGDGQVQSAANARFAQVGIHQKRAVAELRQRDRQIHRGGGFAFPRQCAGHQDDLRRMIGLRE